MDGATVPPLTTQFAYDASGELRRSAITSGAESLVTELTHDTAGRLVRESSPGRGPTTHAHDVAARSRTTALPDGATRVETHFRDGGAASVSGTAVVAEYQQRLVEPDGRTRTVARLRTAADLRLRETWTDWLGRLVRRSEPGFGPNPARVEELTYDFATGLPEIGRAHV